MLPERTSSVVFSVIVGNTIYGLTELNEEASTTSKELIQIPDGTKLDVIGLKNGFYQVVYNDMIGWILSDYAIIQDVADTTETANAPITTTPSTILKQDAQHRLLASTVSSYNYHEGDMTYCSMITRLNLLNITNLPQVPGLPSDSSAIARGDAIALIAVGINANQFEAFDSDSYDKIETYLRTLDGTVYDLYAYHNGMNGPVIQKGHRATLFLGDDDVVYALDPVMKKDNLSPMPLTEYLQLYSNLDSTIYIFKHAYLPSEAITTVSNDDADAITVSSAGELAALFFQGKLKAEMDAFGQPVKATFLVKVKFKGSDGTTVVLPAGLTVSVKDGFAFNALALGLDALTIDQIKEAKNEGINDVVGSTIFGIDGQHLVFTQPVKLTIATPGFDDGVNMNMLVEHAGMEGFTNYGLTLDPEAICNPDGSVSTTSPDGNITVTTKNETVTFYTCGASTFLATPSS